MLVRPDQVEQLPCWRRDDDFVPREVGSLSAALSFDDDGKVISNESAKRKAVRIYLDSLYGMYTTWTY